MFVNWGTVFMVDDKYKQKYFAVAQFAYFFAETASEFLVDIVTVILKDCNRLERWERDDISRFLSTLFP